MNDPEDDRSDQEKLANPKVVNIDREFVEDHLAHCRAFAVEWITKGGRAPDPGGNQKAAGKDRPKDPR